MAPAPSCCDDSPSGCIFDKALLAQQARCECATRRAVGERLLVECSSAVARTHCVLLAALLHERARFALKLPPPGRPVIHMQALRLQCGGLRALQQSMERDGDGDAAGDGTDRPARPDVHQLVAQAQARHGSLTDLPWPGLVAAIASWQMPRRRGPPA